MNLQQLKSQASLEQKLLIEKVENLVRSEYDKDELLAQIKKQYMAEVESRVGDLFKSRGMVRRYNWFEQERNFCYEVGDIIRNVKI